MSKAEEETLEKYYYTCEECDLSFEDYDQHIKDYHADAEVVLKPVKDDLDDEYSDEEEMEIEFLDDAVEEFECSECLLTFSSKKRLEKHKNVEHRPKTLVDFVVFVFDPDTKKCKKLTFSISDSSAEPTMHSLLHRQYYNAFTNAPNKPELAERDKDTLPAVERAMDGFLDEFDLTCEQCDSKFPSAGALRLHRKAHSVKPMRSIDEVLTEGVTLSTNDSERYFCEICQRSLDMSFKDLHIASHAEQRVFCTICNRKFDTQENLDSHMRALPDHTPFKFGKKFETDPEILKTRQYECGTCGKRFIRPHEKVKHERIHEGARPFKCEICLKTFRTNTSLVIHLRHHTDLRPYNCHICGRRFNTSGNLKEHVATHFDERNFQCKLCPKAFKTAKGLSGHKLRHGNPFVHKCPKCPRSFSNATSVTKHLLTHDSKSKIDCPLCEAVFSRKDFFQAHMDKDHVDVDFKTIPVLNNHVAAIHGTARNYGCDTCGKTFKTNPQLAGHKQSHTKNHICMICNRRFSSLYDLKQHKPTHDATTKAGQAPKYECSVCGASFMRNLVQMYEAHMLEHDIVVNVATKKVRGLKVGEFLCTMCPTNCKNAKQLREHIENTHMLAK